MSVKSEYTEINQLDHSIDNLGARGHGLQNITLGVNNINLSSQEFNSSNTMYHINEEKPPESIVTNRINLSKPYFPSRGQLKFMGEFYKREKCLEFGLTLAEFSATFNALRKLSQPILEPVDVTEWYSKFLLVSMNTEKPETENRLRHELEIIQKALDEHLDTKAQMDSLFRINQSDSS